MTKEQLIEAFSLMPADKLKKLYDYADNILIPDKDILLHVTAEQMIAKAHTLADTYFPEWTDRGQADFGQFLIELIALFSEKDFFYANAGANEAILKNMNVYSNAFLRSVELGYSPTICRASQGSFDLSFSASIDETIYPIGSLIVSLKDTNFKYTNLESIIVESSTVAVNKTVILKEGSWLSETQNFNGVRVSLRKNLIDAESIKVVIDGLEWTRVRTFGQSNQDSTHYTVLPEINGQVSIYFGEGSYGKTPDLNASITVYYLKCNASEANDLTNIPLINKNIPSRPVVSIALNAATHSGSFPESLDSLKNRAITFFSSRFAAINSTTTEEWLNAQSGVKQSKVLIQGNNVYFRVIPSDGTVATSGFLTSLEDSLNDVISDGFTAVGLSTSYVIIPTIALDAFITKGSDIPNTIALIKNYISDFTNPLVLAKYGKSFNLTDVEFLLRSKIIGLQNTSFTTPSTGITVPPYEILQKVLTSNINVTAYEV